MLLSKKQREFWRNCNHRWNIKAGATRSGKTYMDYYLIAKRLLAVKDKEGLNVILGNTRETIRRNILLPMQSMYGVQRIGNIRADNSVQMFGQQVFILGADNAAHVDKIRGASVKYCYGDEVTTWSKEVFEMLKSRLDKEYSMFDGTCNPAQPTHWFKTFLDSNADIYQQSYTIDDNPFLPFLFIENLKKEYAGTVYYNRYILGLWAMAEGLIYPMFTSAIKEQPNGVPEQCVLSIDYGTLNAFAAIFWWKFGDVWYAVDEYYYSGRDKGTLKTDEEYVQDIVAFTQGIGDKYKKLKTIVDPSAASFIALLRKKEKYKVVPAENAVLDGIRETATCLQTGKIKVSPKCKNWKREVQGYIWDEKCNEDKPIKQNDHLMDAMRYFVKTMHIVKPKDNYTPLYMR